MVSLVARDPHLLLRQLAPGHHVLVLSSDETTPAFVAGLLTSYGYGASRVVVLGDLGSAEESRTEGTAATWSAESPRLNVIALELDGPVIGSWAAGLPDDAYEQRRPADQARPARRGAGAARAPARSAALGRRRRRRLGRHRVDARAPAVPRDRDRGRRRPGRRRSGSTPPPRRPAPRGACTAAHPTRSPTCPTRTRSSSAAVRPTPGLLDDLPRAAAARRPARRPRRDARDRDPAGAAVRRARRRAHPSLRRARRADRRRSPAGPRRAP